MGDKVIVLAGLDKCLQPADINWEGDGFTVGPWTNICAQVVYEMLERFEFRGHLVFTGTDYTSPMVYLMLYNRVLDACGTARTNLHFFPEEVFCVLCEKQVSL